MRGSSAILASLLGVATVGAIVAAKFYHQYHGCPEGRHGPRDAPDVRSAATAGGRGVQGKVAYSC